MGTNIIDTDKKWSVNNCRSILAFCLLRQIVREFEHSCQDILETGSDREIEYLVETLKDLLPESKKYLEQKFDKNNLIESKTLSQIFNVAYNCLSEPIKALDYSIHNALTYFLEDCDEMPDLDPTQIQAKVIKFFFPEINIPENNLDSFLHQISSKYRSEIQKSLETIYLDKLCKFTNDIVELRYLCN